VLYHFLQVQEAKIIGVIYAIKSIDRGFDDCMTLKYR